MPNQNVENQRCYFLRSEDNFVRFLEAGTSVGCEGGKLTAVQTSDGLFSRGRTQQLPYQYCVFTTLVSIEPRTSRGKLAID